jgi:hypothetical protein
MRASIIAGLLVLATSQVSAQFTNQSAPFNLVVTSSNTTINGSWLIACHEGAAEEGLCVGAAVAGDTPSVYNFNYSSSEYVDPAIGTVGILTYLLIGGNFNVSSPMQLAYNPASNVAVPLLLTGPTYQEVVLDAQNNLAIPGYIDDRVVPTSDPYSAQLYYRWYVCTTYEGYTYQTLAWTLGDEPPQNPTCQKVNVVAVYI